jgi:alpha-tubulin suppressor-like RCC1 family protein
MDRVSSISTGAYHSLTLKNDGTVWSTGSNGSGQLGTGRGLSDRNHFEQVKF